MPGLEDKTLLLCSGTISFPCGESICTGKIVMPCGAQHSTRIAGEALGKQLPYRYQVFRERSRLSPCCYWRDITEDEDDLEQDNPVKQPSNTPDVFEFVNVTSPTGVLPPIQVTVSGIIQSIPNPDLEVVGGWSHETVPSFLIVPNKLQTIKINGATSIPTKCQKAGAENWHQGLDGTPPCNGAKTECPFYTGPIFKYIKDEHTAPGQPVKGHVVQELRHYIQDWTRFKEPQVKWEEAFEEPYIWARDFDDLPTAIQAEGSESNITDIPVYTILTRIYWDVEVVEAELEKFPSEQSGSRIEGDDTNTDRMSPPQFPTLISNLGHTIKPPIEIKFPIRGKSSVKDHGEPYFYEGFEKDSNLIYIAGTSYPVMNLYIINKNFFPEFPDLVNKEISDDEITVVIKDITTKAITIGNLDGYKYTTSNQSRFWQVKDGIELKSNVVNEIYVLANTAGKWNFDYIEVDYRFHHVDIVQDGLTTLLEAPATQDLITRISTIHFPESYEIKFNIFNFSGSVTSENWYHFHIRDKSLSNLIKISGPDEPNDRYWKVVKEEKIVVGTGLSGDLRWIKLDNCNRFLISIENPLLSAAVPAGLDRSWEPISITFSINQEPGTSSHGVQQSTTIEMQVVDNDENNLGRSLKGFPLPIHCVIVEPKTNQDIKIPSLNSEMTVKLEVFKSQSASQGGTDSLPELLSDYRDNSFNYDVGGVSLPIPLEDDLFQDTPYLVNLNSNNITVKGTGKFDLSFMIEFKSNNSQRVVGKKWIYGVMEISNTWCRDIDIRYMWVAPESILDPLLPDYNKVIIYPESGFEPESYVYKVSNTSPSTVTYLPMCGDHDMLMGRPGALFAPYEDCDTPRIVETHLGLIINVELGYALPRDEKYRGPDYQRVVVRRHNVFGTLFPKCWFEYSLGTFTRGPARWMGRARLRGPISMSANSLQAVSYKISGSALPKFGNIGREQVRVFRTIHFREYIYLPPGSSTPKVGLGWMSMHPYIGSDSLFNNNSPKIVLEQMVRQSSYPNLDFSSYTDVKALLARSTDDSEPEYVGNSETESFLFERKKFDDVYTVRKVRDVEGNGVRWPPQGFYFNFISDKVVWAWPEVSLDIVRNIKEFSSDVLSNAKFLSGLTIRNIRSPSYPESIVDKYNRPVFEGLNEDEYTLKIKDIEFDTFGNIVEYASVFINESLKLYFDRFTGEIKDTRSPSSTAVLLHTVSSVVDLTNYLSINGLSSSIQPYFEHINAALENSAPTAPGGLDTFDNFGNLYINLSKIYIYPISALEGPLDDIDVDWTGFYPSLDVVNINPRYLPKKELIFNKNDYVGINPLIKFNAYPTNEPLERLALSNTYLTEGGPYVQFFDEGDPTPDEFEWKPYLDSDLTITGTPNPDLRIGYTGSLQIECMFTNPIEVSHFQLAYEIYSLFDTDPDTSPGAEAVVPEYDPAFKVELIDPFSDVLLLIDKPEQKLVKYQKLTFNRQIKFSYTDKSNGFSSMDPFITKTIRITVGSRKKTIGFKLSRCFLKCLKLNDTVFESVLSVEPKYMISTGLHPNTERLWAQDPNKLVGLVSAPDISDPLEYNGIMELWRAGNLSEENTTTEGKLRRHYAGKYNTWDTQGLGGRQSTVGRTSTDVVFFDNTVLESESRQLNLIQEGILNKLNAFLNIKSETSKYFLSPYDNDFFSDISNNIGFDMRNLNQKVVFDLELFNADKVSDVTQGELPPGWQDPGYYACLDPKTQGARCDEGTGIAYVKNHGYCRLGGKTGVLHELLDLGRVIRPGVITPDPNSALLQQELNPNDKIKKFLENTEQESVYTGIYNNIEEEKLKNKRYQS